MIFDGRWKWELKKQSWAISLWQRAPSYGEYGKHKLNRAVLYSATVLRKAIEDEIEAEKVAKEQNWTLPECKIMSGVISATKYPYTMKTVGLFVVKSACQAMVKDKLPRSK